MTSSSPLLSLAASRFARSLGGAICLFIASASLAQAELAAKASEDFQWKYSPTVLPNLITPSSENWVLRTAGSGNSAAVNNGVLSIASPTGSYLYYEARAANWRDSFQSTVGFTVELKVQVAEDHTFGVNLAFNEGSLLGAGRAPILKIDGTGTFWQDGEGSNVQFSQIDTGRNDDGYHVFRLVKLPGTESLAGAYNIYRDGALIAENVAGANPGLTGLDRFFFGAIGSALGQDVQAQVEWIRWDASGAYAPIPEPMTMTFVGAGGLLLLTRKFAPKNRK